MERQRWKVFNMNINLGSWIEWVKKNKGATLTVAFIALLLGIVGTAFVIQSRDMERQSWYLLYRAQMLAFQGQTKDAHQIINEIESRYARSKALDFTLLLDATLQAREANWAGSIEKYKAIIERNRVRPLIPMATIGLAKAYEATNALDKAVETYQNFTSAHADHFALPQAYESLARLYEAKGDQSKSKEFLERVRVLYPESIWSRHAEAKLKVFSSQLAP